MSRSQLAPGVEVVAVDGRELAVRTADGEFLRVRTGDADVAALRARLAGADTTVADGEVDRLVAAFGAAGYLTETEAEAEAEDRAEAEGEVPGDDGHLTGSGDTGEARRPAGTRGTGAAGDPTCAEGAAAHPAGSEAADKQPAGSEDADKQSAGSEDADGQAAGSEAADKQPAGSEAADGQPEDFRTAVWPAERRDVLVLGDPVLTEPLTRLLREAGAEPRPGTPAEVVAQDAHAVVWCLDGPVPDGLWDDADRLPERGVAWLRCHREGWQAYLEPIAATPGDVTSAHLRARRLAATPAHRELAAYWSGPRTTGAPVRLTTPAAALLAALLADDLARWAGDVPGTGAVPARRRLRRVDLRTLTVTEHPVLPVPDVARIPVTAR